MALAQSCDALATTHRGDRDGASLSRLNRSERATRRGKGDGGEGLIWGRETGAPKTSTQRTPGKARQQGTLTLPLLSLRKAGENHCREAAKSCSAGGSASARHQRLVAPQVTSQVYRRKKCFATTAMAPTTAWRHVGLSAYVFFLFLCEVCI